MTNLCIKRSDGVLARIIVHPTGVAFDHYIVVEDAETVRFKLWLCTLEQSEDEGGHGMLKAKWKSDNELVVKVPSQQSEISVYVNECRATVRQLARPFVSPYELSRRRPLAKAYLAM
jgi:hypothetical protein